MVYRYIAGSIQTGKLFTKAFKNEQRLQSPEH